MMKIKKIVEILKKDGIGVLLTDTIYGLVGSAFSKKAVSKIYHLKKRNLKKPMIILISSLADLSLFKIKLDKELKKRLNQFWPGKISIILPCLSKKFNHLHRGTNSLAFRLPAKKKLLRLLRLTGPLAAPSANIESYPPALTVKEAKKYFGDKIDFYLDEGRAKTKLPSTLIELKKGKVLIKRKGLSLKKEKS